MRKHYDATKHISAHDLATILGVTRYKLVGIAKRAGIKPIGRVYAGSNLIGVYDREAALAWAESITGARENVAPAPDWNLMSRSAWTPKGRMADNFDRASEVYQHRFITPKGTGNYREFGNLGRGEA